MALWSIAKGRISINSAVCLIEIFDSLILVCILQCYNLLGKRTLVLFFLLFSDECLI